jgi:hypothetical protein
MALQAVLTFDSSLVAWLKVRPLTGHKANETVLLGLGGKVSVLGTLGRLDRVQGLGGSLQEIDYFLLGSSGLENWVGFLIIR